MYGCRRYYPLSIEGEYYKTHSFSYMYDLF